MSLWNMPAGCLGSSDLDHYAALGLEEEQCPGCKLGISECECCNQCGATPDQACESNCGLDIWQERSELFAPPNVIHEKGIE